MIERRTVKVAKKVERLLTFLDKTDGDVSMTEGDAAEQTDDEMQRLRDQNDDCGADGREEDCADLEPTLGCCEGVAQGQDS